LALAVLTLLGYLAKRFPWFGLFVGSGIVATAVYLWQRTSMRDFRSDGSAAGAVLMVFFGLFEIVLVSIGIGLIGTAFVSWRFGSTRDRAGDDVTAPSSVPASAAPDAKSAAAVAPTSEAPEKTSGAVKWFSLVLGGMFAVGGVRLVFGFSNDLLCGRKGCIDFFGILAWVKSWGDPVTLGFCYLAIASLFFMLAYNAFFPPAKPRAWLDKYRKEPRTAGAARSNTPPSR
jgi:hypothetical protein